MENDLITAEDLIKFIQENKCTDINLMLLGGENKSIHLAGTNSSEDVLTQLRRIQLQIALCNDIAVKAVLAEEIRIDSHKTKITELVMKARENGINSLRDELVNIDDIITVTQELLKKQNGEEKHDPHLETQEEDQPFINRYKKTRKEIIEHPWMQMVYDKYIKKEKNIGEYIFTLVKWCLNRLDGSIVEEVKRPDEESLEIAIKMSSDLLDGLQLKVSRIFGYQNNVHSLGAFLSRTSCAYNAEERFREARTLYQYR